MDGDAPLSKEKRRKGFYSWGIEEVQCRAAGGRVVVERRMLTIVHFECVEVRCVDM